MAAKRPDGRRDDAAPLPRLAEPVTDFGGAGKRIGRLEPDESDETLPVADREDRFAVGSFEYGVDEAQRILFAAGELHEGQPASQVGAFAVDGGEDVGRIGRPEFVQRDAGQDRNRFHADKDSASRGQKQTKFAALPRRRLSKRKLVFRKVRKPRAKANEVCGFAEAEYLRHSQSTIFLCQSAAGGGCVGRLWWDDAALRMGRLRAAALRVLTEERIFLADFDCEHVRNIPTFDWAFPERSRFTTFCHRKVAPKVSARRKRRGTAVGLRLKRYADKLAPAFSPAHPRPFFFPRFRKAEQ